MNKVIEIMTVRSVRRKFAHQIGIAGIGIGLAGVALMATAIALSAR